MVGVQPADFSLSKATSHGAPDPPLLRLGNSFPHKLIFLRKWVSKTTLD
jgi:hypothetical protein